MIKFVLRRLASAVPLLLLVSFAMFLLLEAMPGSPALVAAGENASAADIAAAEVRLGLDQPFLVRYADWVLNAAQGDLGTSLFSSQSVSGLIMERLPVTLSVAGLALLITLAIGLPLGIAAAVRPNSWTDRLLSTFASLAMALPPFVVGLLLVLLFAITLDLLPATGYIPLGEGGAGEWLASLALPALAIATLSVAELARQTRASLVGVLQMDYIRTVRAKGMLPRTAVLKHGLKNAGVPVATVLGIQVNRILAGAVTVEFVFALPGIGSLAVSSVNQRDIPLILGVVMFSALVVLISNVLVDLSYGYFNPKSRS